MSWNPTLGAILLEEGACRFKVWAPLAEKVEIHVLHPSDRLVLMERDAQGYHEAHIDGAGPGTVYRYRLNEGPEYPDPASRSQPQGVHGPSQVISASYQWDDLRWSGVDLRDYVIYELHVGTFTPEGTFESVIPHLDDLRELGVSAIEFMPVAQFPGDRNWGYDGVYPFAVQGSYGGPQGLRHLVNECHMRGLAVVLDVVYNHLGPEGNYLGCFGPYFTDRYHTPWGQALNFDGPDSDHVRLFFIENALNWVEEYHIDALRLDAVHAILDHSPITFLEELGAAVHGAGEQTGRRVYVFPESADNDRRLVSPRELGGYGLDAQWNDDFHHSLHVLLTGETEGYYQDYCGLRDLVKAFGEGYVYTGEYSPYRRRRHGSPSRQLPSHSLIVCAQNHDQVGNRMMGDRLASLVSFEALKLAAALVILSPFVPLLFMGEEYGETAPFLYFVSHSNPELVEAVRRGRKEEFASFAWAGEPPDPQSESTYRSSKINRGLRDSGEHAVLLSFYRELFRLRKEMPALSSRGRDTLETRALHEEQALFVLRRSDSQHVALVAHFSKEHANVDVPLPVGEWRRVLDSAEVRWGGPGSELGAVSAPVGGTSLVMSPLSCVLLSQISQGD